MKRILTLSVIGCLMLAGLAWGANTQLGTVGNYQGAPQTTAVTACTMSATTTGCSGLTTGDCGTLVRFTANSAITITLPSTITVVNCAMTTIQVGTGQITYAAGGGAGLHSAHSFTKSFGQFAISGIIMYQNSGGSAAQYIVLGDGA